MLISVQITFGSKILRPFGLVDVSAETTLLRLFHDLSRGVLNTGDRFVLEPEYSDFPVESSVSTSMMGNFQSIPMSVTISALVEFGKYVTFNLTGGELQKESRQVPVQNAFQLLMGGARKKTWPKQRQLDRPNARYKLHNDIVQWLQGQNLGWDYGSRSLGDQFVNVLGDALWLIDPHRSKLSLQQCVIPEFYDIFQGYNCPSVHKHVCKPLKADELQNSSQLLFNILEQSWICKKEWSVIREATESLASVFNKYASYLKKQLDMTTTHHKSQQLVRQLEDSIGIFNLPTSTATSLKTLDLVEPIMTALNAKEAFQFICVNEMLPLDRKKRYESIRTLKLN
ncbi:uncharacterized protein [Ptychodera flava]|uniref:uncharacterized protein n=1 Tax=Ptychodera flava TaxID=63121 RepID=UPI00396A5742